VMFAVWPVLSEEAFTVQCWNKIQTDLSKAKKSTLRKWWPSTSFKFASIYSTRHWLDPSTKKTLGLSGHWPMTR